MRAIAEREWGADKQSYHIYIYIYIYDKTVCLLPILSQLLPSLNV